MLNAFWHWSVSVCQPCLCRVMCLLQTTPFIWLDQQTGSQLLYMVHPGASGRSRWGRGGGGGDCSGGLSHHPCIRKIWHDLQELGAPFPCLNGMLCTTAADAGNWQHMAAGAMQAEERPAAQHQKSTHCYTVMLEAINTIPLPCDNDECGHIAFGTSWGFCACIATGYYFSHCCCCHCCCCCGRWLCWRAA
jgi:hypothetical protein